MNHFPRIRSGFTFDFDKTYIIPIENVGRMDKISLELYNSVRLYKPLAVANNIKLSMGFRAGIRPNEEALRLELEQDGLTGTTLETRFNELNDVTRVTDFDWVSYYVKTVGYINEAYEDRLLYVPTFESANKWLDTYESITPPR